MNILVINCGSSSIKYKLFASLKNRLLTKGIIENIGELTSKVKNHSQGVKLIISDILKKNVIKSLKDISAIGHRVVHGAEIFTSPQIINALVLKQIKKCSQLASLHNPANLAGIMACKKILPKTPQVAVFDTAFHQTMPEHAYMYPLPRRYYQEYKIRKYGFHGTSHQFVTKAASLILKKPLNKINLITCHLGNGCSITAIRKGKSIDTSMGFTPLEGLMMGSRCGDIDVAAAFYIMRKEGLSFQAMDDLLNKKSGFIGVSGISNDLRVIKKAKKRGNRLAKLAYEMFIYRVKKYIGSYYLILGKVDAICLTGGIGEHAKDVTSIIKKSLKTIGANKAKVLVIPTDEELMIANLTHKLVKNNKNRKTR